VYICTSVVGQIQKVISSNKKLFLIEGLTIFETKYTFFPGVNKAQHTKVISLAPIDHGQMENCFFTIESTRHMVTLPVPLVIDFARVSVQGVKSLGGHFACLCRGFEFYEVKFFFLVIIFQKEDGNTFTLLIIFIVKSLQKEQNSTNLLLWPPICRNKPAITPK
jgi:hypothetical protein